MAREAHEEFVKLLADLDEKSVEAAENLMKNREDAYNLLDDIKQAVEEIGKRYEKGEYFISELVMTGDLLKEITDKLKPVIAGREQKKLGKVVIGTVEGDVHDIGKNIVITFLETNGFDVVDLGIDVPAERFVDAIKKEKPQVVGLSGLLTEAIESMKKTVDEIKSADLRDDVNIIVGGGRVDDDVKEYTEADAWARDASTGLRIIKEFVGGA